MLAPCLERKRENSTPPRASCSHMSPFVFKFFTHTTHHPPHAALPLPHSARQQKKGATPKSKTQRAGVMPFHHSTKIERREKAHSPVLSIESTQPPQKSSRRSRADRRPRRQTFASSYHQKSNALDCMHPSSPSKCREKKLNADLIL